MKPSELRTKLNVAGVLFEEVLLLEMIRDMDEQGEFDSVGVRVFDVVALASASKLASPATTYKYLQNLNEKLILSKAQDDKDARVTRLTITNTGKKLLEEVGAR